ncbi:MAG: glycosyltransferase family 4 protein [Pseudomonadota bacterium]|nr:glycosyltransferase family 4 protein [Pseudomonadota bacterium]
MTATAKAASGRPLRIAFFAPLKPPDHPHPSGDRRVARLLIAALQAAGHRVELASRLRTREANGEPAAQSRIVAAATAETDRLVAEWRTDPPNLWFTYHLYYKAPDLLGPAVSRALGIPYVAAEASHAAKRLTGPHADFAQATLEAIRGADRIFHVTSVDRQALAGVVAPERLNGLPPFTAYRPRPPRRPRGGPVRLLVVAMMRPGDKLASYRQLGVALRRLKGRDWHLTLIGDGPAARQVMAELGPVRSQVTRCGRGATATLPALYHDHDLMVWPAVNEAYGMALLEAQAFGQPVLAGAHGGVPDIVDDGRSGLLVAKDDVAAFARALGRLLHDAPLRRRLADGAWRHVLRRHSFAATVAVLDREVRALCGS